MTQPQLIDKCCNTPATDAVWKSLGADKVLATQVHGEDRTVYRTGPKDSKIGIIGVHDIFGYHPTTHQFYDRLATAHGGFQVSVPYFFKDRTISEEFVSNRPALMAWLAVNGSYKDSHFDEFILAAVEDLKADGCEVFVIYGQCWGTFIAMQAVGDEKMPFLAAGGPHPSALSQELIEKVPCPIILLPAKEDMDMLPLMEIMKEKNLKVDSFHHRFENVHHGWTGARGDWTNPEQLKAAEQAIHMLAEFTEKVVKANKDA
ncbi:hypothetical protein BGZ98_009400 [Dissophora globulifera]|nr:hypothetical protein BGZ98_009400 [Dissophora globulifera]